MTLAVRWASDDGEVILAMWAYDSLDAYHVIQNQVSRDPASISAQAHGREHHELLYTEMEKWLMTSTAPLELTALSVLAAKDT